MTCPVITPEESPWYRSVFSSCDLTLCFNWFLQTEIHCRYEVANSEATTDCFHPSPSSTKPRNRRCRGRYRHPRGQPHRCRACRPALSCSWGSHPVHRRSSWERLGSHYRPFRGRWSSCGWSLLRRTASSVGCRTTAGKLAGFVAGMRESWLCFVGPSFGVVAAVACIVALVAWRVQALASET